MRMCKDCKLFQNLNILFEIREMCLQLIHNANISLETCTNVFGSIMDPYKGLTQIRIWIIYGSYVDFI